MKKMTCPGCGVLVELEPKKISMSNLYTCKCGYACSIYATVYKRQTPKRIES